MIKTIHNIGYDEMKLGRRDEIVLKSIFKKVPIRPKYKQPKGPYGIDDRSLRERVYSDLIAYPLEKAQGMVEFRQRYRAARDKLREEGLILATNNNEWYFRHSRTEGKGELEFYGPLLREIIQYWSEQPGREYHLRQRFLKGLDTHGAKTGAWTAPDLTVVGGKVLPLIPGKYLSVYTFEVKRNLTLVGLYEALAHRRRSHYSYVLYALDDDSSALDLLEISHIVQEASKQGIGIIIAYQLDDYQQWNEIVSPERHEPDPAELNGFLEEHKDRENFGEELISWIQRDDDVMLEVCEEDVDRLMFTTEELVLAKRIIKRLRDSAQDRLRFEQFEEFRKNKKQFKHIVYTMRYRNLVRSRNNEIEKASDKLYGD